MVTKPHELAKLELECKLSLAAVVGIVKFNTSGEMLSSWKDQFLGTLKIVAKLSCWCPDSQVGLLSSCQAAGSIPPGRIFQ